MIHATAAPRWAKRALAVLLLLSVACVPVTVWAARHAQATLAWALATFVLPLTAFVAFGAVVLVAVKLGVALLHVAQRAQLQIRARAAPAAQPTAPAPAPALADGPPATVCELKRATPHTHAPPQTAPTPSEAPTATPTDATPVAAALPRRQFLARVVAGTAGAATTALVTHGAYAARRGHCIERVAVTLPQFPAALDGFTIAQLSDLHIGLSITRNFVENLVMRTNALGADLIVITGDLVDGSVADLHRDIAPLAHLRAPHGVFAVTGNHEFYSGVEAWCAHYATLGIRVLRNAHVRIGADAASFDLLGVEDRSGYRYGCRSDLAKAMAGRDPQRAAVLLAHQPRQARAAQRAGLPLVLAGHTHGGQLWPWHYMVRRTQGGFLRGRYQLGTTTVYVNRGAGYWGPPVRIGAPPEIALITLRSPAVR